MLGDSPRTRTILIAEREEPLRTRVCQVLASEGYSVFQACTGEEAVRTAARHERQIDLLLTNVSLPGLHGWELAELIKLDYPQVKVLYMLRHPDVNLLTLSFQSKGVLLAQPLRGDTFLGTVRIVLGDVPVLAAI